MYYIIFDKDIITGIIAIERTNAISYII